MNGDAPAPASLPPGALFGVPGFTQPTEQKDNNDGFSVNLSQTLITDTLSSGITNFKQVDVVSWWEFDFAWTNTLTPGTSTITTSAYFPFNILQSMVLSIQNLYKPLEVPSGIDAAIFQLLRPMRQAPMGQNNLFASPNSTFQAAALPQSNLDTSTGMTSATTAINFTLEVAASMWFDIYYHLDKSGSPVAGVAQPQRAIVSPIYMAGSARYVQPQFKYAPGSVGNLDNGPFNIGAGTGTYSGSVKFANLRRVGWYISNDPRVLPPVMNPWQIRRMATQFTLSGRSAVDIPLQAVAQPGQLLLIYVRLWDPAANGGLGSAIPMANVIRCQLQYGSGLFRFDDTPLIAQRRIMSQHNTLLPQGVIAWDLALDNYGRVSNALALNTLTTAGVNIHIDFTAAQSTSAYAVVGTELLVIVE